MHTRALAGLAAWLAVGLLAGCGGDDETPFAGDAAVVGRWLEVSPSGDAGVPPDDDGYWPTRALTLRDDGTYLLEEGAPEQYAAGAYQAERGRLALSRTEVRGTVAALSAAEAAYGFLHGELILSEETPTGSRAYRFARVSETTPPAVAGEWLLARRLSGQGADLPCVATVRYLIEPGGECEMVTDDPGETAPVSRRGSVLATARHVGLRLPAARGEAGRLCLLGAYTAELGVLLLCAPDASRLVLARRTAPDLRLIGEWEGVTVAGERLIVTSDGACTWTTATSTLSAAWRTYHGGYLCLLTPTIQRAYAMAFWGQSGATLTLGAWVTDGDCARYNETTWRRAEP